MKLHELLPHSFKAILGRFDADFFRRSSDLLLPSMPMVNACRADDFDFFRPLIDAGKLTVEQMHHAAGRYLLGKGRSGQPIYWMIDDMRQPLDGHIGNAWVSASLKVREPALRYWQPRHCLFGLHLTADDSLSSFPVSIVESERTAVLLSEVFPRSLWLSTVPGSCFTISLLKPLQGRVVKVFPHTDETMSNYVCWLDLCDLARRTYHLDIECSMLIEDSATPDQKRREIDLYDLYIENL